MTSEDDPPPPTWDLGPIYDLLKAFRPGSPTIEPSKGQLTHPRVPSPSRFNPKANVSQNLGDFNVLYKYLDLDVDLLLNSGSRRNSHDSLESSFSDQGSASQKSLQSTPPSSSLEGPGSGTLQSNGLIDRRKVRWTDEVDGSDLARSRSRTRAKKIHKSSPIKNSADFDSETEPESFHNLKLFPASVTPKSTLWVPPPIPNFYIDPMIIQPIDTLTIEEKRLKLVMKLNHKIAYRRIPSMEESRPLHIFVDCSNIVIGFYNELKIRRGLDVMARTRKPPLSWEALAFILERCRPIARKVLVGSSDSHHVHRDRPSKTPDYMIEAQNLGYELNVLDKVFKYKSPTPTKKKGKGNGYATTSGHSSGSDGNSMASRVVAEQAVDELLHMKMLESIVDTHTPATIVLATGDAAEAEFSGGFLKNVERALVKGWKVELVAWSAGLSREYQSSAFLKKWKGRFTIIELDDFSEELLALYAFKAVPILGLGFGQMMVR